MMERSRKNIRNLWQENRRLWVYSNIHLGGKITISVPRSWRVNGALSLNLSFSLNEKLLWHFLKVQVGVSENKEGNKKCYSM